MAGPIRDEAGNLQGARGFLGERGLSECVGHQNFLQAAERPVATFWGFSAAPGAVGRRRPPSLLAFLVVPRGGPLS